MIGEALAAQEREGEIEWRWYFMIVLLVNPLFARQELAPNPFSLTFPNYCSKQQLVAWTLIVQGH